ncbi:hypothetical protein LWF15_32985 [Kineosporia rhizophila]|uniref:hypothetical protein n=1 Tax=Kineosporia TaxID=49184 RepID=UPI001E3589BC|nr:MULTISPECIES: hypothetical protein [Kineosporia]MCE0540320.1 hypothetical protein [Kineosporia rhizophila]
MALDAEWQRRFTSMVGVLACEECVLEAEWKCHDETGNYVSGHIPAAGLPPQTQDVDSWSHLLAQGSQVAMIKQFADPAPRPVAPSIPNRVARVDLSEQRTELMGLIDAWQTTRPSRSRAAK